MISIEISDDDIVILESVEPEGSFPDLGSADHVFHPYAEEDGSGGRRKDLLRGDSCSTDQRTVIGGSWVRMDRKRTRLTGFI